MFELVPGIFATELWGPGLPIRMWVTDPHQCRRCNRMTVFFVNRWGLTQCVNCDEEQQRGAIPRTTDGQTGAADPGSQPQNAAGVATPGPDPRPQPGIPNPALPRE